MRAVVEGGVFGEKACAWWGVVGVADVGEDAGIVLLDLVLWCGGRGCGGGEGEGGVWDGVGDDADA